MSISTTNLILRKNELEREINQLPPLSEMSSKQRIMWYCAWARKDEIENLLKRSGFECN